MARSAPKKRRKASVPRRKSAAKGMNEKRPVAEEPPTAKKEATTAGEDLVAEASRDPSPSQPQLSILVSSVVHGHEDLLESIYALLEGFGYDVLMSHKGTIPVDASQTAMANCLEAVDKCDLFLGLILPQYGSGRETTDALSITHREVLRAIEKNKPRWFLVHEHVANARQLLQPMRDEAKKPRFVLRPDIPFKPTPILSDLRVIEMFEAAMRHDVQEVAERIGNWVQHFGSDDDARLFVTAQFRRHRELLEKHLPKLADIDAIRAQVKRVAK